MLGSQLYREYCTENIVVIDQGFISDQGFSDETDSWTFSKQQYF